MCLISVIVPVYKTEKYLSMCIESVLNQTYKNFELILVNDGSPDRSKEIMEDYAKRDFRIKTVYQMNGGLSAARNKGLDLAIGEYVAFLDSDDWFHPMFLEILQKEMKESGSDISIAKYTSVSARIPVFSEIEGYSKKKLKKMEALFQIYLEESSQTIVSWNKLYKKSLFAEIRFPIGKLHEDEYTTHKILMKAESVVFLNCNLYYYYTNLDGITKSGYNVKRLDILTALETRLEDFEKLNNPQLNVLAEQSYYRALIKNYYLSKKYIKDSKVVLELKKKIRNCHPQAKNSRDMLILLISHIFPYTSGWLLSEIVR